MRIDEQVPSAAVLEELGRRIARRRLDAGLTQDEVAREAGIGNRTLERIEAGADCQVSTLVRVLAALGLTEGIEGLVPEVGVRPIELLENRGRERKRAPRKAPEVASARTWRWGDEE